MAGGLCIVVACSCCGVAVSSVEEHVATRAACGPSIFRSWDSTSWSTQALQRLQTRDLDRLACGRSRTRSSSGRRRQCHRCNGWRIGERRFWLFAGKRGAYGGRDRSGRIAILALQGPASGSILAKLVGRRRPPHCATFIHAGRAMVVGRIGFSGELGYELLVPAAEALSLRARLLDAARRGRASAVGLLPTPADRGRLCPVRIARSMASEPARAGARSAGRRPGKVRAAARARGLELLEPYADADLPSAVVTANASRRLLERRSRWGFIPPGLARATGSAQAAASLVSHRCRSTIPRGAPTCRALES